LKRRLLLLLRQRRPRAVLRDMCRGPDRGCFPRRLSPQR